jgi:hypothetical protein
LYGRTDTKTRVFRDGGGQDASWGHVDREARYSWDAKGPAGRVGSTSTPCAEAARILPPVPTLADYPHLVAQLDRKNGPVVPESIAYTSRRRLWWRCPAGPDHLWSVPVRNRGLEGTGCPFCAGRSVSVTNALSTVAPAVARQWHPTKNGDLRPRDVVAGTYRTAWWKCSEGPDHEWSATIDDRVRGKGCPFCAGRRATAARNLAVASPALALEWHPTRNGALRPEDVLPQSNRVVWWSCPHGHEWSAKPTDRARGNGCPYCSGHRVAPERSLAALLPALARQWHPTKNGELTARDVTMTSGRRVWWKCRKGPDHEWQTKVGNRAALGCGCPFCAGLRVSVTNSLAARFPKLAREWHPTKNGDLGPHDVIAGSHRRVWWRCAFGHDWQAELSSRSGQGCGCPECWRLRRRAPVATTGKKRKPARFAAYEGTRHGPVRGVR